MYNQFFGLRKNPFHITPDPDFLFLTTQHRESLAGLTYAILERKGFVVLTGEVGTGKTTILARALQSLPASRIQFSVIMNPTLTPSEFLEMTLLDFGIQDIPASKPLRLQALQNFLLRSDGKTCALVVDEAHKLSPEILEEIRLLGNFERGDRKLLQILLVGQSELDDLLNRQDLRQLKQRIALRFSIKPLSNPEVDLYIRFRWTKAGGTQPPFTMEAIGGIAQWSRGIPRVINAICDNALLLAFGEGTSSVDARHIRQAATDLYLVESPKPVSITELPALSPVETARTIRTLERYCEAPKTSFWMKWAGRFGLAQKAETT